MFTDERSGNMLLHRPSDWEAIPHPEAELVVAAPVTPWMTEGRPCFERRIRRGTC